MASSFRHTLALCASAAAVTLLPAVASLAAPPSGGGDAPCDKANSCGFIAPLATAANVQSIATAGPGSLNVTASTVPARPNVGLLIYNNDGFTSITIPYGVLCLQPPFYRATLELPAQTVGGCLPVASSYTRDMGAWIQTHGPGVGIQAGKNLYFQAWYRDPDLGAPGAVLSAEAGPVALVP